MSIYIIPSVIVLIFIYGVFKKVDLFGAFTDGAKDGIKTLVNIALQIYAIFY